MPRLHIRQSGFPYNAYGLFTKRCKRIRKCKKKIVFYTVSIKLIRKACFAHDAAYSDS